MESNKEERTWAMLCHIATFSGGIIPLGNIIAPLIIWLVKKDQFPLVNDQGKEALNFQISITIYLIASIVLCLICVGFLTLIGTPSCLIAPMFVLAGGGDENVLEQKKLETRNYFIEIIGVDLAHPLRLDQFELRLSCALPAYLRDWLSKV